MWVAIHGEFFYRFSGLWLDVQRRPRWRHSFVFQEDRLLRNVGPLPDLEDLPTDADEVEHGADLEPVRSGLELEAGKLFSRPSDSLWCAWELKEKVNEVHLKWFLAGKNLAEISQGSSFVVVLDITRLVWSSLSHLCPLYYSQGRQ